MPSWRGGMVGLRYHDITQGRSGWATVSPYMIRTHDEEARASEGQVGPFASGARPRMGPRGKDASRRARSTTRK
eukprot:3180271-Pyramimonas_sp.AAC.1